MQTPKASRRMQVYRFIVQYKRAHDGNSPTFREMMDGCGINSTSQVTYYLGQLEALGMIVRPEAGAAAKIEVIGGKWLFTQELHKGATC